MSANTRSPLKDKPLRLPGQSLEEERRKLLEDKLEIPLLLAMTFVVMTAMEWWRYYAEAPPQPLAFSVGTVGLLTFTASRRKTNRKDLPP